MDNCEYCGEIEKAEYELDGKRLCFECYVAEKKLACAELRVK
jgi:hypothetical protein